MVGALLATALVGASCISTLVAAIPLPQSGAPPAPSATSGDNPFAFPLSNGFPEIAVPSQQLTDIELQALGTLPNGPPPPSIGPQGIINLQVVAFNEIFEVAFFTELLANVTNNVPGYQLGSDRQQVIDIITAVQAQEELHALNANGALAHFGAQPIQPCKYAIPVTDFNSAIALASTFTDVVLGTLQDVEEIFGVEGDNGFLRGIASVIGQEGEQNGYYRLILGKIPSALPFLTTSTREFAFSALNQLVIVPGSCPNIDTINLPIFGPLNVLTNPVAPTDQNLQFSFTTSDSTYLQDTSSLSLVYINQQNLPVVEPLQNVKVAGNTITFDALFPYNEFEMNGLTIAAVTKGPGAFATADDVAKATLFGPGLIEIN